MTGWKFFIESSVTRRLESRCAMQHNHGELRRAHFRTASRPWRASVVCTSEQRADRLRHTVASMLGTIAIVLIVLWLLGMVSSYTIGGLVHILLVVAVIIVLLQVIQGRRLFGR